MLVSCCVTPPFISANVCGVDCSDGAVGSNKAKLTAAAAVDACDECDDDGCDSESGGCGG